MIVENTEVQTGDQFTHAMTGNDVWTAMEPWGCDGWMFTSPKSNIVVAGKLYTNETKNLQRIQR